MIGDHRNTIGGMDYDDFDRRRGDAHRNTADFVTGKTIYGGDGIVDGDGNMGEVLVGAGVWQESQLNLVAISSVDLSEFGGPILPGAVSGNPLTLKVWDSSEQVELSGITYDIDSGSGTFDELFSTISE